MWEKADESRYFIGNFNVDKSEISGELTYKMLGSKGSAEDFLPQRHKKYGYIRKKSEKFVKMPQKYEFLCRF